MKALVSCLCLAVSVALRLEASSGSPYPIILVHGFGDSCENLKWATNVLQAHHKFVECISHGPTPEKDSSNSIWSDFEQLIDDFAMKLLLIKMGPLGAEKLNAIGISQGGAILRGYIQRYQWSDEYPKIVNLIAVHSPLLGIARLPVCKAGSERPKQEEDGEEQQQEEEQEEMSSFCSAFSSLTLRLANLNTWQQKITAAGYARPPHGIGTEAFVLHNRMARLNGESIKQQYPDMATQKAGFASLNRVFLVRAEKDFVVQPSMSSWFGCYKDNAEMKAENLLGPKETKFYKEDTFGLKTLIDANRVRFETTPGGHVQFSSKELVTWARRTFRDHSKPWDAELIGLD